MSRYALHLNDAGLTLLDEQRIVYREPGFAWLGDERLATGNEAFAHARIDPRRIQHRYWSEIGTEPLRDSRFRHLTAADIAATQLEQIRDKAGAIGELVVAVPSYLDAAALGLFLGIAEDLKIPVVAMVDAAVAATRREYRNAVPVHVDIGLHRTTLVRLAQPGHAQVDRVEVVDNAGTYALFDAWMTAVAEAFVMQSRFDPLHTAETEQTLLDRLGGWLREAAAAETVQMSITSAGTNYEAAIDSLALTDAAAPVYPQIATRLRTLFRAEDRPALQVTDRVSRLPGLTEMLKARVGGEVFVLEAGATARGALARCRGARAAGQAVSLLKQLPWDQTAIDFGADEVRTPQAGVPTHLLFGHVAYAIGNSPLVLGSEQTDGERGILLEADMPGVSRRHCSVLKKNGQCVLQDLSRYGTFLNGHRIEGSTVLQAGDAIRVGTPGFEFRLITTDEGNG